MKYNLTPNIKIDTEAKTMQIECKECRAIIESRIKDESCTEVPLMCLNCDEPLSYPWPIKRHYSKENREAWR